MNILNEFKKIDKPWVLEVITERFDFLPIDAMSDISVIYGGAVRDAIAGIRLQGDLDIVVPQVHMATVLSRLDESPKWVRTDTCRISHAVCKMLPSERRKGKKVWAADFVCGSSSKSYGPNVPMELIIRYVNQVGVEIEIIQARNDVGDAEACVIEIPKNVDIICCGLVMDKDGVIYEIIEGAHDQCMERVLRFNEIALAKVDIDRMIERIKKLTRRGYKSEIDVDDVRKRHIKAAKVEAKKPKKVIRPKPSYYGGASTYRVDVSSRVQASEAIYDNKHRGDPGLPPHFRARDKNFYQKLHKDMEKELFHLSSVRKKALTDMENAQTPPLRKALMNHVHKVDQRIYDLSKEARRIRPLFDLKYKEHSEKYAVNYDDYSSYVTFDEVEFFEMAKAFVPKDPVPNGKKKKKKKKVDEDFGF